MNNQLIFAICFATVLILLLTGFLFFMLFWQRRKSNRFIREREVLKARFNEQLLTSKLEIQEQSFNAISMEIHDNVGQTLSVLKVQLNIIEQQDLLNRELLTEAKGNLGKALVDLRDIAKSLNSERLQQANLTEIVEYELQRISHPAFIQVAFTVNGIEREMNPQKKLIMLRIVQECLQNCIKHAQASLVNLQINYKPDEIAVTITDDGKGFNRHILNTNAGLGLQNIVKRAAITGGSATIDTIIEKGTTITITTPYE